MPRTIQSRPTPWTNVILLCRKCSGKMKGGYGPERRQGLREVLRSALKAQGQGRRVRLVEVPCLGLCPKKAVAVVNAGAPGRILSVPKGAEDVLSQILTTDCGSDGQT